MPKAWIARFGRTVAGHVLDAVAERMTAPRAAGLSATLGGEALPGMGFSGDGEDAAPTGAPAPETRETEVRAKALSDWLNGETGDDGDEARRIGSRTVSGRELALGSAFSLTGATAGGGTAGFWGRAAVSGFDGREGELIARRRGDHGPGGRGLRARALADGSDRLAQPGRGRLPGFERGHGVVDADGCASVGALRGAAAARSGADAGKARGPRFPDVAALFVLRRLRRRRRSG